MKLSNVCPNFGTALVVMCCIFASSANAQLRPSHEFKMVYYEMKLSMCSPVIKYCAGERYRWIKGQSSTDEMDALHALCRGALDRFSEVTTYDPNASERIKEQGRRYLNDLSTLPEHARKARLTGCRDFLLYGR